MKIKYFLINLILFLLFLSDIIFAQQFSSKYYTEEEGLPDAQVNDILQDEKGRIWFATRSGIGIYDGNSWVYHNNTNGLLKQNILKIQFDNFNKPWVLSSSNNISLSYLENNKWNEIKGVKLDLGSNFKLTGFKVQYINNELIIFVGTKSSGLFIFRHGYWSNLTKEFGLPSSNINSIEFYNNLFFVGTSHGAVCFDKDLNLKPLPFLEKAGHSILLFKSDVIDSNLWLMGDKNIGYIKNDNFINVAENSALKNEFNYYNASLVPNYFNSLVYSCYQSLLLFEKDSRHSSTLNLENGLPQIGATSIFLDREKNLWITGLRGVTKISSMRFANYNNDNGLFEDEVSAINEIKNGELIFGHNNGFSFFSGGSFTHLQIKSPLTKNIGYNRVLDIAVDGKGNAYFAAAETGFGRIDINKNVSWLGNENKNFEAASVEVSAKGNLYCLTYSNLYLYEKEQLKSIYSFEDDKVSARKIFFHNNEIFIATTNRGLAHTADAKKWTYIQSSQKKEINNVYSFLIDNKFGKLVGTEAGLFLVDGDSLKKFMVNDFEINRPVYFIASDTLNNLWMGTNNGVYCWDGEIARHYSNKTGLLGHETNRDAGYVCSKGCIWIGTDKGASRYLRQFDKVSEIAAPIVILDSILIDGISYPGNKALSMPASKNNVIFEVDIISFIAEDHNILDYKLEGYDAEWQKPLDSKSSFIRYTNLPPGEYYLNLKAYNVLNQVSEIVKSEIIVIEKPFYSSYWFYLGVILLLVFFVFVAFKEFERIQFSKKLEKEIKVRLVELKESESKYESLLSNLQDGFFVVQDGIVKLANNALARMLGYELHELIDRSYENLIAPENLHIVLHRYNERQSGANIINEYEFKMLHKNGSRVFVNMNVNIGLYEGNKATIGTLKDITERKRNEELLNKLSTAVKQSPNIVIITDQYGVIEYVNPTFTLVSGYTFEEIKNRNINLIKSGLIETAVYDDMWITIKRGDLWRGELINKKKNGELYWVRATISPIIDGKEKTTTHYLATQEDITFEKYANEEIQKGEKLINTVLNNVPVMIFAFDKNGNISFVNGKILGTLGFTQEMAVGKSSFKLFAKSPDILNDIKMALNGESFTSVRRIRRYTFEVTYTPMYNSENKYTGTLGIAYNITDRKKYEIDLIKAKEEAEKSDRLKSEFLAQMSHEIRTPINSILSFTTLLKEELKNSMPEDLADGFIFIENGAKRLIRTIDLILNMSQIQTGTYQPYFSELDLDKDILRGIITEFQGVALNKKIDLNYSVISDNNFIKGDSYTLGQIFANLVDNAIKYTPKGKIEVEVTKFNGDLVVKINDTGIGISNEFIPDLFTPFTQEESGYTRKFEGNGLGLALVKKYVEMNNAVINVESQKGIGTSFAVSFKGIKHLPPV